MSTLVLSCFRDQNTAFSDSKKRSNTNFSLPGGQQHNIQTYLSKKYSFGKVFFFKMGYFWFDDPPRSTQLFHAKRNKHRKLKKPELANHSAGFPLMICSCYSSPSHLPGQLKGRVSRYKETQRW